MTDTAPQNPREAARQSYSGQRMTSAEFEDAYAVAGIIAREIQKSGSFFEARENYAFAFSKGKKISAEQAKDALGDIFTERYGQSMNQMRETLIAQNLQASPEMAAPYAAKVSQLITDGETMPLYKAVDQSSAEIAQTHGMTQNHAKTMMKEAQGDLYDLGKELEAAYHAPVIAARKAQPQQAPQAKRVRKQSQKQRHTQA